MKFTVTKEVLYPYLQYAGNFTTHKNLSNILQNILIEADEGYVTVKSTNFQMGFSARFEAKVSTPGSTTVSAKKLTDIVKEFVDGEEINFIYDGSRLHVKSGKSTFQLATMDAELFPSTPNIVSEYSFKLNSNSLIDLFKRVSFCISNDTTKIEYNGAHLSVFANTLEISSADYQRIATSSANFDEGISDEFIVNIPKKTVLDVMKIFDSDTALTIETDKRQIVFKSDNITITSKLIEKYIKGLTRLFSTDYNLSAKINRSHLHEVVKRISAITSDITHGVQLSFAGVNLTVTSLETEYGKGNEIIEGIDFDGESIDIIFNARHLLEILSNITSENVTFSINTPTNPVLILPDNNEAKYLIVPISIEKIA